MIKTNINWKKEGYEVGDEVCIVSTFELYSLEEIKYIVGKVTHVGTKILKVTIPDVDKEKTLKFNGRRSVPGGFWERTYCVYKTKEDYQEAVAKREKAEELKKYISKNLDNLALEDLEVVGDIIDKKCK